MKRSFLCYSAIVLLMATMILPSCRYKELCYDHDHQKDYNLILKLNLNLDLDLGLDVDIDVKDETASTIKVPSHMVVCFYDSESDILRDMEFVGPYGGPLQVTPGVYNMVVYSFDTEFTQIRGESKINTLEAFTSDITSMKSPLFARFEKKDSTTAPGPIIYTPDHLLVTRKEVVIPDYSTEERVITVEATASTIMDTYSFEVTNISGIEYVSSVDAFITNQAKSSFFGRGVLNLNPATIYFPMEVNRQEGIFETTFNTFGKLPGESRSYLNIVVINSEGKSVTFTSDITDQFLNPEKTIVIEDSIIVPPPGGGGGIAPTVEEWNEEIHDVPIG